jgi:hypothetical protein
MSAGSAAVGISLSLGGTLCNAVGYTLQKLAHRRVDAQQQQAASDGAARALKVAHVGAPLDLSAAPPPPPPPLDAGAAAAYAGAASAPPLAPPPPRLFYWTCWQFWLGLAIVAGGAVLGVVSFGFAGQATLGPVGAVTLVWIELLSWRVLRERFTRADAGAVALMLAGAALALVVGGDGPPAPAYDLDGVLAMLSRPAVFAYGAAGGAAVAAAAAAAARWGATPPRSLPAAAAAADAVCRAGAAGALVGCTGLFVKATVEVVTSSLAARSLAALRRPQPYFFVAALLASLAAQVTAFNGALARYDASVVAPIYQISLVFSDVATGWVCWQEAAAQTPAQLALFAVGVAACAAGIALLACAKAGARHGAGGDAQLRGIQDGPSAAGEGEEPLLEAL